MSVFRFGSGRTLKAILIGVAASIVITMLLTICVSGVTLLTDSIPYEIMPYIMLAVSALGVFCGSLIAASITREKGLMTGLICGFAVFLIALTAGFVTDGGTLTVMTAIRAAALPLCGALGGIRGVNRKEKVRIR